MNGTARVRYSFTQVFDFLIQKKKIPPKSNKHTQATGVKIISYLI